MGNIEILLTIYLTILLIGDMLDIRKYQTRWLATIYVVMIILQYTTIFGLLYFGGFYE